MAIRTGVNVNKVDVREGYLYAYVHLIATFVACGIFKSVIKSFAAVAHPELSSLDKMIFMVCSNCNDLMIPWVNAEVMAPLEMASN